MRTFTIELRCRFADESKYDIMTEHVRDAARTILSTAMLLKDNNSEPQIMLSAGDMFERNKDMALFQENEEKERGE